MKPQSTYPNLFALIFTLITLGSALVSCSSHSRDVVTVGIDGTTTPEIRFGLAKVRLALESQGKSLRLAENVPPSVDLRISVLDSESKEPNDGFILEKKGASTHLSSESSRGLLYGLLAIADALENGKGWDEIDDQHATAHFPFRAIKFNLPWYSYRSGENLDLHTETCRDLKFWESFLDMMLENKFNTLSLWNMHPFIYMVKPQSFPEASPFTDDEMAEWQTFWHSLFAMARERGIDTYIVNWNIFVSEEFATHYGVAKEASSSKYIGSGETSPEVEQYTRELVTQTLNEYPDLTGIGITLGERMGDMTSAERSEWVNRTLIAGLKAADRPARLIYRAPLSANKNSGGSTSVTTEKITRDAIEDLNLDDDVWIEFKFNWSHGHSSPRLSIVHGGMLTDTYWHPPSDKYKAVWTMRNEDFFALRWAQPDFIREFIQLNSQAYTGGCIIGSECYIPAKDYITKEEHQHWDYAFQRQWLFYEIWGNLLFDPQTPDSKFAASLEKRFPGVNGIDLLKAWKLSSNSANRLASFYRATWDATLYSEAFAKNGGKLIQIDELINQPVLDASAYISINEYVDDNVRNPARTTPLQLADQLDSDCQEALRLAAAARNQSDSKILQIELNDIESWAWHGQYFAQKLRGGVALAQYRKTKDEHARQEAIARLTEAKECWLKLTDHMEKYNVPVMPYQFDQEFSWRKQLVLVEKDIAVAKGE